VLALFPQRAASGRCCWSRARVSVVSRSAAAFVLCSCPEIAPPSGFRAASRFARVCPRCSLDFTPALGIVRLILPPQASPARSRFCQLACSSTRARHQQQPPSGVGSPQPALGVRAAVCRSSPSRPRLPSRHRGVSIFALRFLPQQISSSACATRSAPLIPVSVGILGSSSHRECCQAKTLSLHELSSLNRALSRAEHFSDEPSASHVRTAADG
jgi:hypothetical protein